MFYFPVVSSMAEVDKYRRKVDDKIEDLYNDLKLLVEWEDTLNIEINRDMPPEHKELLDVVNRMIK